MYCSDEWVGIFQDIASRDWKVRLAWSLFELCRGTPVGTLMLVSFGFFSALRCVLKRSTENDLLTLAIYRNESSALARLKESLAPVSCVDNNTSISNCLWALTDPRLFWRALRASARSFSILSKASRRDHFVSLCQTANLLVSYPVFLAQLQKYRPRVVAISSASIPQPLALVAAARTLAIPSLFASHASFAPHGKALVPPTDVILMDGHISLEACNKASDRLFTPILWGVGGSCHRLTIPQKPLSQLSVGLFLTAPVVMEGVSRCLRSIYENIGPVRVVLRPHPIAMLTPNLQEIQKLYPNLIILHGESLERSIEHCEIVLSGNSNVHREVLRFGVPSLYVSYLDTVEYDYWGLVRNRITLEATDLKGFSLDQLQRFHDTSWADRFRAYDDSYLEALPATQARVKREVERFINDYQDVREEPENRPALSDSATLHSDAVDTLTLRPARLTDSALLLEWRNEEAVRQKSTTTSKISEETHSQWYASVLHSSLSKIYILMKGETPVGQIRFTLNEGVAVLSYSLDKPYRGQGLGAFLVGQGVQRALRDFGNATIIRALVKPTNTPSLAALRKVGFISRGIDSSGSLIFERNNDKPSRARSEEMKASE